MSFVRRRIDVTISLGSGDFGEGMGSVVTLTGLRVSAAITKMGDPGLDTAQVQIFGLTADQMNKISSLGKPLDYARNNTITLMAGDDVNGMSVVYFGTIYDAYQNFDDAPSVSMNVNGLTAYFDAIRPVAAVSYTGGADAAVILSGMAQQMNPALQLENNGVQVQLSNPYFSGSILSQIDSCCSAAGCYYYIDGDRNTLAIWPKGGSRGGQVIEISPASGLVGYPQFMSAGVRVTALYLPGIAFGARFNLVTSITPANGTWIVNGIVLELESETPDGKWFVTIQGTRI